MPQFFQQFDASVGLDLGVVKAPFTLAFEFTQLGQGNGIHARENQIVQVGALPQVSEQLCIL